MLSNTVDRYSKEEQILILISPAERRNLSQLIISSSIMFAIQIDKPQILNRSNLLVPMAGR